MNIYFINFSLKIIYFNISKKKRKKNHIYFSKKLQFPNNNNLKISLKTHHNRENTSFRKLIRPN